MRALMNAAKYSYNLLKRRVTAGAVLLVSATVWMSLPTKSCSTRAALPWMVQCAQGYSGCIGVER